MYLSVFTFDVQFACHILCLGKTNMLIVGKDAGFSKVSKARALPNIRLMNIKSVYIKLSTFSVYPILSKYLTVRLSDCLFVCCV